MTPSDNSPADDGTDIERPRPRRVTIPGDTPPVPPDTLFRLLADSRRRHVLYYLQDHHAGTLDELAAELAAREAGPADGRPPASLRRDVTVALHHSVVPELSDGPLVRVDGERVAATDQFPRVEPYLDFARAVERGDHPP